MLFPFEQIIEHISKDETLVPGEFIGSGTVGGGGQLAVARFMVKAASSVPATAVSSAARSR